MVTGSFNIEWIDGGKEPKCKPDPLYPNGKNIDVSDGNSDACLIVLPYPAKRCGIYIAECRVCGYKVMATTAGRPDDPRMIKVACKTIASA